MADEGRLRALIHIQLHLARLSAINLTNFQSVDWPTFVDSVNNKLNALVGSATKCVHTRQNSSRWS